MPPGLPIQSAITPGQWGDSPQTRRLIEGLTEAQHVIMDAAYDADDLGATAHSKRNPARREDRSIDWMPYNARHLVECFFNRIKRFRQSALRCENPVRLIQGFRRPRICEGLDQLDEDAA